MKSAIKKMLLILMFISCTFHINAQEELANGSLEVSTQLAKVLSDNLNTVYLNKDQNTNHYLQNNNLVQVTQIGNYNYSDIHVQGKSIVMNAIQNGNNNYVNVYKNATELNQNISQIGNNNFISDFSVYSIDPINTKFNQEGNNLTIISTGSNSISKNLEINQFGNSGTVYIYNR